MNIIKNIFLSILLCVVNNPIKIRAELDPLVKLMIGGGSILFVLGAISIGKGYVDLYKVNKRSMEAYNILEQSPLSKYVNDNSAAELSDIKKLIQDEAQLASYLQHINQYNRALRDQQDAYELSKNIITNMNWNIMPTLMGAGCLVGARWLHIELNKNNTR